MYEKLEWKLAFMFVVISFIISLITFLLSEIIWGDVLKSILSDSYKKHEYTNINIIIIVGLGFIFGISMITNIVIFREYTAKSKVMINLYALIFTILILFFIASISVMIIFAHLYAGLALYEKLMISWLFFAYFSVYILPSPIIFWIIGLIIYHVILLILMRYLLVRKYYKEYKFNKKTTNKEEIRKYKLLG